MTFMMFMLIFSTLFGILTRKYRLSSKLYILIIFIVLATHSSLRGENVGLDTSNYLRYFHVINSQSLLDSFKNIRLEKGYIILNYILGFFTKNPQSILFLTSIFINFSFARTILKYSDNLVLSTLIYIMFFYQSSMNGIRQYLAFSIFLIAIDYLVANKKIEYTMMILFASLFHNSVLVLLLFLVATGDFLIKRKWLIMFIFVCAASGVNYFSVLVNLFVSLFPSYGRLLQSSLYTATSQISIIWLLIYIILFFINFHQTNKMNISDFKDSKEFYYKKRMKTFYSIWQIFFIIMYIFSTKMWIANRMLIYFKPVLCFIVPSVFYYINKEIKHNLLSVYIIFVLYLSVIGWSYTMFNSDPHSTMPYSTYFENI